MPNNITLYEKINYGGASLTISEDTVSMPTGWDNRASSAKVSSPIAMFDNNNYGGSAVVINQDTPDFRNIRGRNFDKRIGSVRYRSMYMKLNVIIGEYRGNLSHTFEQVREQVERTNEAFGPYGIYFNAKKIMVAPWIRNPISYERQMRILEDGYLDPELINCLFFEGGMWRRESWIWYVSSVKLVAAPGWKGSLGADLYDGINFLGKKLTIDTDQDLPASHNNNVKSVRLHSGTAVEVYSSTNYKGQSHTFRHHTRDLAQFAFLKDWWTMGGHCCGWNGLLARVSGNNSCILGQELGHKMLGNSHSSIPGNIMTNPLVEPCGITFNQAENYWQAVMASSGNKQLFDFLP